jgi:hypothetical protein
MFYQMTRLLLSCSMTVGYPDSIGHGDEVWVRHLLQQIKRAMQ